MSEAGETRAEGGRRRRGRFGLWAVLVLFVMLLGAGLGLLALTGRPVVAPQWLVQRIEAEANARLDGAARISLGGAELVVGSDLAPRIRLTQIALFGARGEALADLPELRASLSLPALAQGRIAPATLTLSGASLSLRRRADGTLDLGLGGIGGGVDIGGAGVPTLGGLLSKMDEAMALPLLSGITRIQADALSLKLEDARAGRVWQVGDGRLTVLQDDRQVSIELGFGLAAAGAEPARATITFVARKGSPEARMQARIDGVEGADIASEVPALAFLKVVHAPISGDFRAAVGGDGAIETLEGSLGFGKGAVQPAGAAPVRFDGGTLAFSYDPKAQKVSFSEISVQSPSLRVKATAQAYLQDIQNGLPRVLVGQVALTQVMVDPQGLFEKPVRFSQGAIDLKLTLDPFRLQLGQLMLLEGPRRIEASGSFTATPKGWQAAVDARLNQITSADLLALWPVFVVPQTRDWLAENVLTGTLYDVRAALRADPGQQPEFSLGYDFTDAEVRFLKTLPPIKAGRGYAVMADKTYTMTVDAGHVAAPEGGDIDVAGSVFEVPDVTEKPAPGVVKLKTRSTITAALSLLDQKPFQFLTKAGQPVDLADGTAVLSTEIRLPLIDKIDLPDVTFTVAGTLSDVTSDKIIKGRVLTAPSLNVAVDNDRIAISGKGKLGVLPVDVTWSQGLGEGQGATSHVEGTVELSQAFVDEFHLGFPPGAVTGKGEAKLTAEIEKGGGGSFALTSDMAGVGLALPELGWGKPAGVKGALEVSGRLGTPLDIQKLSIVAPNLSAQGKVVLNANSSLNAVRFSRVKLGGWLDGPVDILGRGAGGIAVSMTGGTIDLRRAAFKRSASRGLAVPITLALDRLVVSEGISLSGFKGAFTTLGGFNGTFTAGVNGAAGSTVRGTVVPDANGTAVRIRGDDAGAIIAAAGVFEKGRGGSFELTLTPRAAAGEYDGTLKLADLKVVKAPALADLLEAISIIGLLDQLNGPGIGFSDVEADFRLTPNAIDVVKGSAVGPSMGISAAGLFNLDSKTFDMQGVISPIYFLNFIGSVLTRKGEGLFGFNYKLRGTSDDPKVSVNPLSILTPGMFRDLFRQPPPTLDKTQ